MEFGSSAIVGEADQYLSTQGFRRLLLRIGRSACLHVQLFGMIGRGLEQLLKSHARRIATHVTSFVIPGHTG